MQTSISLNFCEKLNKDQICHGKNMLITEMKIWKLSIPYKVPFVTATRTINGVEDIVVTLHTSSGLTGFGSACASPLLTGETTGSVIHALSHLLRPVLIGSDTDDFNRVTRNISSVVKLNTAAKAACDMAVYDLKAKSVSVPLYKYLGGTRNRLSTGVSIGLDIPEFMAAAALQAVNNGFSKLKIKLGHKKMQDDISSLKLITNNVPVGTELGIDCNQAWDESRMHHIIDFIKQEELHVSMIEQPFGIDQDFAYLHQKNHSPIDVYVDESCFSFIDLVRVHDKNLAHGVVIKLMKSGGITQAALMMDAAREMNIRVAVSCLAESPISLAAMCSLAVSRNPEWVDLDSLVSLKFNPFQESIRLEGADLILSDKPGLGIDYPEQLPLVPVHP